MKDILWAERIEADLLDSYGKALGKKIMNNDSGFDSITYFKVNLVDWYVN